jgi:UDP-2,3-diacylglucosamine hydrolase
MKIAAISDVHVKVPHDEADTLLCLFLDHPLVQESQYVLLLGDIFDLMCGPHEEYLRSFEHIFQRIEKLADSGKKVYFFEGNHDVHLKKLFEKSAIHKKVLLTQVPIIEIIEGKSYYFSHGDEHEIENLSYQRYKKLILSPPLRFVANHIMPYSVLNFLGQKASKISRKKGSKKFDAQSVRDKFRNGVSKITQGKFDFVLGGHSHVQDNFLFSHGRTTYLNNGYALKSKTFIFISNHQISFEPLT